ncbi:MAG: SBBP repeat-containing protein [Ignavibacteria bacterium]
MKKILFLLFQLTIFTASSFSQVNQEWAQRYNGPGNYDDEVRSIAVDGSGNVYITGWSWGSDTGDDYATIKYSSNGLQDWVRRYNGPENADDGANSIAVDGSGNVYVTGQSGGNTTNWYYATIKYNSSGVQQWVQRYNGPGNGNNIATSIAIDGSGNVYVTGWSKGIGTGYDYATIKYSANGVQLWVQRYSGPGNNDDYAYSIAVDGSGNVYITGYSWGGGTYDDYATIKYNTNGVQQWVQRYNGPGNGYDEATSIVVDSSGNVYVTGWSRGNGPGYDFATIKYSASGVQQWVQRYIGPGNGLNDEANSIAVDYSCNVYVTGTSYGIGTDYDYTTIKYNANGVQQWVQRYNGSGNGMDEARSIVTDASGNVYVTGYSIGFGTGYDYATIKYSQNIGIKPTSTNIPDKFALQQNYPNPFNPTTKIKFEIPPSPLSERGVGGFITLTIYDILGREITTLINEQLKPGTYEVEFDGSNYPSGVYFYKLTSDSFNETKKMLMIK